MLVNNVKIYGLENSFRVSKFPMQVDASKCNEDYTERIEILGTSNRGSGHDNFLKGIIVQFDLSFTIKAWTEAERYHWFDIVSSQSTMHKIASMDFDHCFCKYVTENIKAEMKRLQDIYNETNSQEDYLALLYNAPTGTILTAGMTTNYQQLKTIYDQRKNHRIPEWRELCKWMETLPYSEFITTPDRRHVVKNPWIEATPENLLKAEFDTDYILEYKVPGVFTDNTVEVIRVIGRKGSILNSLDWVCDYLNLHQENILRFKKLE